MMPPPLHLSDIRYKRLPYRRCHGAMNELTNEGVYVDCCKKIV